MDNVLWMEKEIVPYYEAFEKKQLQLMQDKGKILLTIEDPDRYLKMSMDAAWEMVEKACPKTGPEMKKMIRK